MPNQKLYFWIDRFEKGGLEKSIFELYTDLKNKNISKEIIICSLNKSKQALLKFTKKYGPVNFKLFKNYYSAYFDIRKNLKEGSIIFSFKNHIPLIIFLFISKTSLKKLFLRHSNSNLSSACLLRYRKLKSNRFIISFIKQKLHFIFQNFIYSLVPYHFCNSLENLLLLEIFTMRKAFCFTNPCYFPKEDTTISQIPKIKKKKIKAIWFARYSETKDIDVLLNSLNIIDKTGFNVYIDIFTSNKKSMKNDLLKIKDLKNVEVKVNDWADKIDISDYEIAIITSFHEGLSNSFMEALTNKKFIIAPLTSSGFLENSFSKVYLYRPGDRKSFVFTTFELFKDIEKGCNLSRMRNQLLFNQEFYKKLISLINN